jgi:hypothetical protein
VIVAIAVGLVLDAAAFAGNLTAEFVGVVVSVAVALTLVERLLERERSRRWERVRTLTSRSIGREIHVIALAYYDAMPPGSVPGDFTTSLHTRLPTPESTRCMREIADYARAHAPALAKPRLAIGWPFEPGGRLGLGRSFDSSTSRELWGAVAPHIQHLQDVLTPRVIELADDPELAEHLASIESDAQHWLGWIEAYERWGKAGEEAWRFAADLLDAAAAAVERLDQQVIRQ